MTEAKPARDGKIEKRLEKEIEIAAPVEEVWKALTEGKELAKWFPLEARVTPGVSGKIFVSWGTDCEGEAEIVAWEPGKKFAYQEPMSLVEWTLEARGGKTILKLAQSGFLGNEDWENEWFESSNYGWGFMLASLKWALEKHRGEDRQVAWPRVKTNLSRQEAFQRLVAQNGIFAEDLNLLFNAGKSYTATTFEGDHYTGEVEFVREDRGFCISIRELNDALLWLTIEGPPEKIEVQAWLSGFGLPKEKLSSFDEKWKERITQLFA